MKNLLRVKGSVAMKSMLSLFLLTALHLATIAQCTTNVLVNPSFESPAVGVVNGNNLMGSSWSGWSTQNGAGLNIIRVNGSNYTSGADVAAHGSQYVDIAGANDYPTQSFTLSVPSVVYFNGKFSNRETGGGFQAWTARVDILNTSNVVVASSVSKAMTNALGMETWFMLAGESGTLAAGTYKYRAYVGDFGHFDDAYLCIQPVSSICGNRISEAGFESPVQSTNNATAVLGTNVNSWYSQNGSNIMFTKVDGAGYTLGPDVAYNGSQYMSLSNTNDYLLRDITLTCPTNLSFSGYFSNRPNGSYTNWTARIDILNSSNAVVASSTTQAFTASTPQENWYLLHGTANSLPAGNYKMRVTLGREGNFDAGYLCAATANCTTLPLHWLSFTARKEGNGISLEWRTGAEEQTLDFIVQHSRDGRLWTNLSTILAAGNSPTERAYAYVHSAPGDGDHLYRILQRDVDGKQSFSEVRVVKAVGDRQSFTISSNSVQAGKLKLQVKQAQTIMLFTAEGRELFKQWFEPGDHYIDVTPFSRGIYLLKGMKNTEKVIL